MSRLAAGIDVGGTWTKLTLCDEKGKTFAESKIPTEPSNGPEAFLDRAALAVRELQGARKLRAVGLGIAGLVESATGVLRMSPNLAGWKNVPVGKGLKKRLKLPVTALNDATAAAWGLYVFESGGRSRNMTVFTLGTGVGGGLVLGGVLHEGSSGFAGEFGHMTVRPDGDPCACGNRGCLEAYAGGRNIVRRYLASQPRGGTERAFGPNGPEPLTPRLVAERANAGDGDARRVWREAGAALGLAVHSLACIVNPDTVFLTGGVSRSAPLLMPELESTLRKMPFSGPLSALKVRVSRHPNPGALGAAHFALTRAS